MTTINPPHMQLAILSRQYVLSRAIHAMAHLGIADHMSDEPLPVEHLAKLTGTIPDLLGRMLNFLSIYGVFSKQDEGYALTPLSYPLRSDHPCSIKAVLEMVDESWWQAFAHLESGLKTGIPGFQTQEGLSFFDFLNTHPDKKTSFSKGIARLADFDDKAIIEAFDFSRFAHLIQMGSGSWSLSQSIASQYPHLSTTTFGADLEENFTDLPTADAYLLKGFLHDFNDEKIRRILKNCHERMNHKALLIIAEQVMPDDDLPHTNKTMDVIMMVLVGGKQRPLRDWQALIESQGFFLDQSVQTQGVYTVMAFRRDARWS